MAVRPCVLSRISTPVVAMVFCLSVLAGTAGATPSQAPPPPSVDYQKLVIAHYRTPTGAPVLFRRGWWNPATPTAGFGWDKIQKKHGILNPSIVRLTVEDPAKIEPAGPTRTLYWGRFVRNECDTTTCREVESVWVKTVVDFGPWGLLGTGEPMGVNTSYCDGTIVCPTWINDIELP